MPRFTPASSKENGEVLAQLNSRKELSSLREIAQVEQSQPTTQGTLLVRQYKVVCPYCVVSIRVGDDLLSITAIGRDAVIFNFKTIVEHLLKRDLEGLLSSLGSSKYQFRERDPVLLRNLQKFLQSEANWTLDVPSLESSRAIGSGYLEKARGALREALGKLLYARTHHALIWSALPLLIAAVAGVAAGLDDSYPVLSSIGLICIGLVSWACGEYISKLKLAKELGKGLEVPVDLFRLDKSYHVMWRGRSWYIFLVVLLISTIAILKYYSIL